VDLIHVAGSGEGQLAGGLLFTRWRETNENISSAFFKYGKLLKVKVKFFLLTLCAGIWGEKRYSYITGGGGESLRTRHGRFTLGERESDTHRRVNLRTSLDVLENRKNLLSHWE